MQDLSAAFPSLKTADDLSPPAVGRTAGDAVRRLWQQPLGDVHVRLNNIVVPTGLKINFDTSDSDFVFDLSAHWPTNIALGARWGANSDYTSSVYEADIIKLADALNDLVRLYAIETGNTRLHVMIEARRGQFEIPGWWPDAPCLFATYAFDTNFAEVGLFTNLNDAYADMDLLTQPHRLLVALGPATPEMLQVDENSAWIDPDKERLRSLKRWNQQMALQINMLMADIFGGGEEAMNAVVDALSRIRSLSQRLSDQIMRLEKRAYRPKQNGREGEADLHQIPPVSRPAGKLSMEESPSALADTLADLRGALIEESRNQAVAPAMRLELQKGLRALNSLDARAMAPARRPRLKLARASRQQLVARTGVQRQSRAAFGALKVLKQSRRARIMPPAQAPKAAVQKPATVQAPKKPRPMAGPKL